MASIKYLPLEIQFYLLGVVFRSFVIRTPPGVRKLLARNEHSNFRTEGGVLPNQLQKMGGRKK